MKQSSSYLQKYGCLKLFFIRKIEDTLVVRYCVTDTPGSDGRYDNHVCSAFIRYKYDRRSCRWPVYGKLLSRDHVRH